MKKIRKLTMKQISQPSHATIIPIIVFLFFLLCGIYANVSILFSCESVSEAIFLFIPLSLFIIFPIIGIKFFKKMYKEDNYYNEAINNYKFKIVEDKIYDTDFSSATYGDNNRSNNYYVYGKIFGKICVDGEIYRNAQKDDSIYFVVVQKFSSDFDKNIDDEVIQKYLACMYELDDELKSFFVPYDESLGESNFNNRIKDLIEEQKKNQRWFRCKKCNEKYYIDEYKVCPKCGSEYEFDIKDVVNKVEWY